MINKSNLYFVKKRTFIVQFITVFLKRGRLYLSGRGTLYSSRILLNSYNVSAYYFVLFNVRFIPSIV